MLRHVYAGAVGTSATRARLTAVPVAAGGGLDAGVHGLLIERSNVVVIAGSGAGFDNFTAPSLLEARGGDAVRVLDGSTVHLWGPRLPGQMVGGAGAAIGGNAVHWAGSGFPAVQACGSLFLTPGAGPLPGGRFAVRYDRGLLTVGPPPVVRAVPRCTPTETGFAEFGIDARLQPGTSENIVVYASLGQPYVPFIGEVSIGAPLPGVANGRLLDYMSPRVVALAPGVSSFPRAVLPVTIPLAAPLLGTQLGVQALLGPVPSVPASGFALSMGEVYVVSP